MDTIEMTNLRILLLNNESVELGLTISENLSDIEFNELVLGNDWYRLIPCDAPVYETYIKNRRLILYVYINFNTVQHLEFILSPNDERYKFYLFDLPHHNEKGYLLSENNQLRYWLTKTILRK